jgi:hypothetical protein
VSSDLVARVISFVAKERAIRPERITLDTTLWCDLGADGADGWDLIDAFGKEFEVDLSGFDPTKHFGPEASATPASLLTWLIEEWLLKRDPHEVWGIAPITIRDLIESAEKKHWITSPR